MSIDGINSGGDDRLRPVHQYLKVKADGSIDLDDNGLIQTVTEDFDDDDLVHGRHIPLADSGLRTGTGVTETKLFPNAIYKNSNEDFFSPLSAFSISVTGTSDPSITHTETFTPVDTSETAETVEDSIQFKGVDGTTVTGSGDIISITSRPDDELIVEHDQSSAYALGRLVTFKDNNNAASVYKVIDTNGVAASSTGQNRSPVLSISIDEGVWEEAFANNEQGKLADSSVQNITTDSGSTTFTKATNGVVEIPLAVANASAFDATGGSAGILSGADKFQLDRAIYQVILNSNANTLSESNGIITLPSTVPDAHGDNVLFNQVKLVAVDSETLKLDDSLLGVTELFQFSTREDRNIKLGTDGSTISVTWGKGDIAIVAMDSGTPPTGKGSYIFNKETEPTTVTNADWTFLEAPTGTASNADLTAHTQNDAVHFTGSQLQDLIDAKTTSDNDSIEELVAFDRDPNNTGTDDTFPVFTDTQLEDDEVLAAVKNENSNINALAVFTGTPDFKDTTYPPAEGGTDGTDGEDGLISDADQFKLESISLTDISGSKTITGNAQVILLSEFTGTPSFKNTTYPPVKAPDSMAGTEGNDGIMSIADKVRLDDDDITLLVEFDRDPDNTGTDTPPVFIDTTYVPAISRTFDSMGNEIPAEIGLMSAADKNKLDGIEEGAILRDWVSYLAGARNTSETTTTDAPNQRTWTFSNFDGTIIYYRRKIISGLNAGEDKIYSDVGYTNELASQYY